MSDQGHMPTKAEMEALLEGAQERKKERDGFALILNDRRYEVWPNRFSYRERSAILQVCGMSLDAAIAGAQSHPVESLASMMFAAMFQQGLRPSMDDVLALASMELEAALKADAEFSIEVIEHETESEKIKAGEAPATPLANGSEPSSSTASQPSPTTTG